jgi:putative tryptophan/tyrosine transport system substrate-binding protein
MKRKEFLAFIGGAMVWPLSASGQQAKTPTVGVLVLGNPDPEPFMQVLREALSNAGYRDGQSIRLEYRSAGGRASALADLADELVRLKVDVIVAFQTPAATAAKKATDHIPIVMVGVGDPLGTGLIASLARPGGNVTGTSAFGAELGEKTFELIREVLPSARRVAVLVTMDDPFSKPFLHYTELGARKAALEIATFMLRAGDDFDRAFEEMLSKKTDALIVQPTLLRARVLPELALKHRLPSFSLARSLPETGGLMSYSAKPADLVRGSALYVDKILKGGSPANLPVVQATTFELVVNLKTAKALGLTIPSLILARADDVIE